MSYNLVRHKFMHMVIEWDTVLFFVQRLKDLRIIWTGDYLRHLNHSLSTSYIRIFWNKGEGSMIGKYGLENQRVPQECDYRSIKQITTREIQTESDSNGVGNLLSR